MPPNPYSHNSATNATTIRPGTDDAETTDEDVPVGIDVLNNDSDLDGDDLVIVWAQAEYGTAEVVNGALVYTPASNWSGTDTIFYAVSDGFGGTSQANVTVTVNPINDAPIASDGTTITPQSTAVDVDLRTLVSDVETEPGDMTFAVGGASNGSVTLLGDGYTARFTPTTSYHGLANFTYTATDTGDGASAAITTAAKTVTISVNSPPVANDDTVTTYQNMPIAIAVRLNDTDVDGDTLSTTSSTNGANGTTVVNPDGTVTYTPNTNFVGTDSFTYTISDGNGGTDTATVSVTVNAQGGSGGSGGTIGDFVWNDADNDGIQDAGEFGVYGVTVKLYDGSNNLIATTTTDGGGYYSFAGLGAGTYEVEFVLPANYSFSPKDQGGNDNTDSDADTTTGRTGTFTLSSGQQIISIDAGLYWTGSGGSGGSGSGAYIGDYVWNDLDHDGIQDANEFGIAGIMVYLFDGSNNLIATTVTDWSGHYSFSGLAAGYYQVEFVKPTGYVFSPKDQGSDDTIDSDADISTGRSAVFYLAPDQQYLDLDAGMYFDGSGGSGT